MPPTVLADTNFYLVRETEPKFDTVSGANCSFPESVEDGGVCSTASRVHVISKMQIEENSEMAQVLQINHEKMKGMGEESYRLKETT